MGAAVLYKGDKNKTDIAYEAFMVLGTDASQDEISEYFRQHYEIEEGCNMHLYYETKAVANGGKAYKDKDQPRYDGDVEEDQGGEVGGEQGRTQRFTLPHP